MGIIQNRLYPRCDEITDNNKLDSREPWGHEKKYSAFKLWEKGGKSYKQTFLSVLQISSAEQDIIEKLNDITIDKKDTQIIEASDSNHKDQWYQVFMIATEI